MRSCLRLSAAIWLAVAIAASLTKPCRAGDEVGPLVRSGSGAVASVNREASLVGVDVMRHGGNAVDAAVAVAFALAVTHPAAGNIGGGGYMVIAPPGERPVAID